jgi:hypothetical protein
VDVFSGLKLGVFLSGEYTEGVRPEVITLSLEDVGRNDFAPVTVQEGESRREGGSGNTPEDSLGDYTPPAGLCLVDS